jgi:glucosamine-6-phosphate deaminase
VTAAIRIFDTAADAARWVAGAVEREIRSAEDSDGQAVLGLPTGATPAPVYAELVRRHREEGLDFSRATIFNLDEYWPMQPSHPLSFARSMKERLVDPVGLAADRFHIPDGTCPEEEVDEHCARYRAAIADAGGIGLQLLGLGANGHIGFNEPGTSPDSIARLVRLAPATVERIREQHPDREPPTHGITLGVKGILAARRVIMMVTGEHKADIARRALQEPETPDVPASFLQRHRSAHWVFDREAASALDLRSLPVEIVE